LMEHTNNEAGVLLVEECEKRRTERRTLLVPRRGNGSEENKKHRWHKREKARAKTKIKVIRRSTVEITAPRKRGSLPFLTAPGNEKKGFHRMFPSAARKGRERRCWRVKQNQPPLSRRITGVRRRKEERKGEKMRGGKPIGVVIGFPEGRHTTERKYFANEWGRKRKRSNAL